MRHQMTAEVLVFPFARRVKLVRSIVGKIRDGGGLDRVFNYFADQQANALRRRGVPEDTIGMELAALRAAVRAELGKGGMPNACA